MKLALPFLSLLLCLFSLRPLPAQPPPAILDHHNRIVITRLDSLNSDYRETNLSITPDGKYLFFQSQRGGMPWSVSFGTFRGQPRYDGDLWYSRRQADSTWPAPEPLARGINTANGEDEPVVSADGQTIIFQSWKNGWESSGGPYYQAELHGAEWQRPVGLGGGINRYFVDEQPKYGGYATDGVAVSVDGSLFLVACGPDYDKPLDIYLSRKTSGQWSYLAKAAISTGRDERSLFIAADNRTLYFASDGYGGFGGLDIFKTTLNDDGSFGEIINIGEPFNTRRDDYGFIITASGEEAYFVRDGDIYYADLREADPRIRPSPTLIVSGRLLDPKGRPVEARVNVVHRPSMDIVARGRSNALTGEYTLAFPQRPGEYEIVFTADQLPTISRPLPATTPGAFAEMTIDTQFIPPAPVALPPPAPAPKKPAYAPPVIQFDFDRSDIKTEFMPPLDSLAAYLKEHPELNVFLTGHTDSQGSDGYNIALGERRARSTEAYLRAQGVTNPIVLVTKGETEPIDDNGTAAGAYRNRRVVIYWATTP